MSRTNTPAKKKKKLGSYPFLTVVTSITLALTVIGGLGAVLVHFNGFTENFKSNYELEVSLDRNISNSVKNKVKTLLSQETFIKQGEDGPEIRFRSKEEALNDYLKQEQGQTKKEIIDMLGYNPTRPSFIIKIDPRSANPKKIARIAKSIEGYKEGVYKVRYTKREETILSDLTKNLSIVSWTLVIFTALAILTIMVLINNTIKLALFSQRFLIRSMQLVGATANFIQGPFLSRSIIQGFVSGLLSSGIICCLLFYTYDEIPELQNMFDSISRNIFLLLGALPVIGGTIGFLATYRAIHRYLKMSLDDLY